MALDTMQPTSTVDVDPTVIETFASLASDITIRVWGGDWCGDCQAQLPEFAAVLEQAGIDPSTTQQYAVEKEADGSKVGPKVDAYAIEYIPTVVIEQNGAEIARFVESAPDTIATELANQLSSTTQSP